MAPFNTLSGLVKHRDQLIDQVLASICTACQLVSCAYIDVDLNRLVRVCRFYVSTFVLRLSSCVTLSLHTLHLRRRQQQTLLTTISMTMTTTTTMARTITRNTVGEIDVYTGSY